MAVTLRSVQPGDVGVFYEHQADAEAAAMAAFPPRERDAHATNWAKILADGEVVARTILAGGEIAGNVVSWPQGPLRLVGYWVGRTYWGRGVATAALAAFLEVVTQRPLHAYVALHNQGSIRVLEKCGFVPVGEPSAAEDGVREVLMELKA